MPAPVQLEAPAFSRPATCTRCTARGTAITMAAVLLYAASASSFAQATTQALQTVVISGTRTPELAAESGSAVTIVTAEELEAKQIRLVSDALRAVPGIAVSRSGPAGAFTELRLRGAEATTRWC